MNLRTFVAIDPPSSVRDGLVAMLKRVGEKTQGVRWLGPDGIHLTLRFLGGVEEEFVEEIGSRLTEVAKRTAPFSLQPVRIGYFPHISRPRIVWVGLEGEIERLKELQSAVEEGLADLPVKPEEKRTFHPHITLGRIRDPRVFTGHVAIEDESCRLKPEPFRVEEMILYKSDLTPKGARYTKLETIKLGG